MKLRKVFRLNIYIISKYLYKTFVFNEINIQVRNKFNAYHYYLFVYFFIIYLFLYFHTGFNVAGIVNTVLF